MTKSIVICISISITTNIDIGEDEMIQKKSRTKMNQ